MHFDPDQATILAVIIGAVMATAGGFLESQLEGVLRKRERERSSALLFGELLTILKAIMRLAADTRGRGDPYGPITMRFIRAARREIEVYDRNREALFDLHNPRIRARIHALIARLTFALDGVTDIGPEIVAAERRLASLPPDDPTRPEAEARVAGMKQDRNSAFDFSLESVEQIDPLLAELSPLARHKFLELEPVLRNT